jgi:hypothetical protein
MRNKVQVVLLDAQHVFRKASSRYDLYTPTNIVASTNFMEQSFSLLLCKRLAVSITRRFEIVLSTDGAISAAVYHGPQHGATTSFVNA